MTAVSWLRHLARRHPLLRAKLLPYWSRLQHLRWQARKLLVPGRPVICSVGKDKLRLHAEGQIAELVWLDCFEHAERDFLAAYLRRGMHVFNIGANIGLYAILASLRVGEEGTVHAFEPAEETYRRLVRNLELNRCRNVTPVKFALSDKSASLVLRVDPKHPGYDGHRFVEELKPTDAMLATDERVRAVTLDEYAAQQERFGCDVIVLDVEGAELAVLRGGVDSISRMSPTILLECSRHQVETEKLLRDLGYRFWSWSVEEQRLVPAEFQNVIREKNVIARREGWSATG